MRSARHFLQLVREFMLGAAISWVSVPYLLRRRHTMENLFALDGYLIISGLSPAPPGARLWLLPYMVPQILSWQHRLRLWDESLETVNLAHIGH